MRKVHCLVIALFLFTVTCTLSPAFAEDSTTSARKDILKQRVDTRKELTALIDSRPEKIATRAAAFKNKIASFRDKRKASASARINDNLVKVNNSRTNKMFEHLSRLSNILSKLEIRVDGITEKNPNIDTANAKAAITSAKAAIDSAKVAVALQAEKDYTISITTESKVREDATKERQMLHGDLRTIHELIVAARQAVAFAISQAAQLGGINNGK